MREEASIISGMLLSHDGPAQHAALLLRVTPSFHHWHRVPFDGCDRHRPQCREIETPEVFNTPVLGDLAAGHSGCWGELGSHGVYDIQRKATLCVLQTLSSENHTLWLSRAEIRLADSPAWCEIDGLSAGLFVVTSRPRREKYYSAVKEPTDYI